MLASLLLAAVCAFAQVQARPAPETTPPAPIEPSQPHKQVPEQNDWKPVDLQPDATGVVPPEQIRQLLRRAEEKDLENNKQLRNYTYIEHSNLHYFDGHGGVKKTESRTSEVLEIYGEQVERLTAKDGKPLSAREAEKENERVEKIIDKRKNESEDARLKRLEKEEKERQEDRKFVLEVADAFNFRLLGSQLIDGRDSWVLDCEPRPGFRPRSMEAKMLTKLKGRIWIDKQDEQWTKLDVTAIDTFSFAWVLARVHKGTHVLFEQTKVNDEIWLPKHIQAFVDMRIALFKGYDVDVDQTYRDYKKFSTDTKITVLGEESH